jgi:hypothetical protein
MTRSIALTSASFACIAGAIFTVTSVSGTNARAATGPSSAAAQMLTQKGLTRLKPVGGIVSWVLEDEAKVRQKLEAVRKAERADRDAARKVKNDSASVARDRETLSKAEKHYQEIKPYAEKPESIPPNIARRFRNSQAMIEALNSDLNDTVATINRLRPKVNGRFVGSMAPDLKATITDWMKLRNELIIAYLAAEPQFNELNEKYKELQKDVDVAAALKELGKNHHLGSKDFGQGQALMAAAETTASAGEIPFYRDGLLDSIGGLLNETSSIPVQIDTMNAMAGNWAPASELAKAGIQVDPAAPTVMLTFTGNSKRVIQCRQAIVPKLRFGKFVLENLAFLALPDDAKDLGTQITSKELRGFDMTPDLEKWTFKLVKKETPKTDDDKPTPADSGGSKSDGPQGSGQDSAKGDKSDQAAKTGQPQPDQSDKSGQPAGEKDAKR